MTVRAWRWTLAGSTLLLLALPLAVFWVKTAPLSFYFGDSFPPGQAIYIMMRPAGHLAYVLLFLQIVLGLHGKDLARLAGVPTLLPLHKAMAIPTLGAVFAHPLLFWWAASVRTGHNTFLNTFWPDPMRNYWTWYFFFGALAFYGVVLAVLAALVGPRLLPRAWRVIHGLTYVSFGLAWYHSRATGAEVRDQGLGVLYTAMALMAAGMLLRRLVSRRD